VQGHKLFPLDVEGETISNPTPKKLLIHGRIGLKQTDPVHLGSGIGNLVRQHGKVDEIRISRVKWP